MIRDRSAAACALATALCCFYTSSALADWDTPELPVCRPQHEWRTPVLVWTPGLTDDGRLPSAPPESKDSVIYINVGLDGYAPTCRELPDNGMFEFDVPKGATGTPGSLHRPAALK